MAHLCNVGLDVGDLGRKEKESHSLRLSPRPDPCSNTHPYGLTGLTRETKSHTGDSNPPAQLVFHDKLLPASRPACSKSCPSPRLESQDPGACPFSFQLLALVLRNYVPGPGTYV